MNQATALKRLKETRKVSTAMLKPLNVTFEQFLRLAQVSPKRHEQAIDALIKRTENTGGDDQ